MHINNGIRFNLKNFEQFLGCTEEIAECCILSQTSADVTRKLKTILDEMQKGPEAQISGWGMKRRSATLWGY